MIPILQKRLIREIKRRVFSRVYIDRHDPRHTVLLFGSPRSGTTWMADCLNAALHARFMFEPFHRRVLTPLGFPEGLLYLPPEVEYPEARQLAEKVFTGRLRNHWVDAQNRCFYSSNRLIKDVSINLSAKWLLNSYPHVKTVYIIRHPFATALSQKKMGWTVNIQHLLADKNLQRDFLGSLDPMICSCNTDFDRRILLWCVEQIVPLTQLAPQDVQVVFYEDLRKHPEQELKRLCHGLGCTYSNRCRAFFQRPSFTSRRDSGRVSGKVENPADELTSGEKEKARELLKAFGLDRLYDNGRPAVSADEVLTLF